MALSKIETNSLDVGQIGGRRNMFLNGAFQVWQRGISFSSAGSGTNADMWRCEPRSGTTVAVDRTTDVPVNTNFSYSWKCSATGATDDGFHLRTAVELDEAGNYQKFAQGTNLILSFWAKKTSAGTQTSLNPVLFLANGMNGNSYTQNATRTESNGTLTNNWQRFVFHYTCPTWAAGAGSLSDMKCLVLRLLMGTNDTPQDLYLTGVQLEYGSGEPSSFEHRSYGEELQLCQRYFERTGIGSPGIANSTTGIWTGLTFKTAKRATPSVSLISTTMRYYKFGVSNRDTTSANVSGIYSNNNGMLVKVEGFSGLNANESTLLGGPNGNTEPDTFNIDAEL
jgi:hypothetical protein